MARASFTTLPLELKATIAKMASEQEKAWKCRARGSEEEERADHINCLSSLALVNKELRVLCAKHQEGVTAGLSLLDPPSLGHLITEVIFYDSSGKEGAEVVLSSLSQLTALRSLRFDRDSAIVLFGSGVTLRQDLEDEGCSYRASVLGLVAAKIEELILCDFVLSETVALVATFPNLIELGLFSLRDSHQEDQIRRLAGAIASLRHLGELWIELASGSRGWPSEALAPLARLPSPIKILQLIAFPLDQHTIHLVSILSPAIIKLGLALGSQDPTLDLTSITPLQLPRLTTFELVGPREQLAHLVRIVTPASTLSHFSHLAPPDDPLVPTDPALLTFLEAQPSLRNLDLWDVTLDVLERGPPSAILPSPSFLAAYTNLVHSRGLVARALDQPHLTPFDPDAKLDYTENEGTFLTGTLRRTLEFGLVELDRMEAEGNVAKAVRWVPKLKALEDERRAWQD